MLTVSFDEPHGPFVAPPEYWETFDMGNIPKSPNFAASTDGKPGLQQIHSREVDIDRDWEAYRKLQTKFYACNSYIDKEIGRVIDTVEQLHGDDTVIIYTSDHGDMQGSHGLRGKGPMMYEEICNIPFIIKHPGGQGNAVHNSPVSHLDIIPTMLELSGIDCPDSLHGVSLAPVLQNPEIRVRDTVMINFHRFAINHDDMGEFYPIWCVTDGKFKLSINLFETDELYDLEKDPYEMKNLIGSAEHDAVRKSLHETLLDEMDRVRDPFRSYRWGDRLWNTVRRPFYTGGTQRPNVTGFPFQPRP